MKHMPVLQVLCLLFCAALGAGCGYRAMGKSDLPFSSVEVASIKNTTVEPGLEDRLRFALTAELLRNGIRPGHGAEYHVEGTITTYDLRVLTERSGIAMEYEVSVRGEFRLVGPGGSVKALSGGGVFIVAFSSSERLESVLALREKATDRALRDLAAELVASMVYR